MPDFRQDVQSSRATYKELTEVVSVARFVPKGKMSKKAQRELNRRRRVTWAFSPVTKTVDSKKICSRK